MAISGRHLHDVAAINDPSWSQGKITHIGAFAHRRAPGPGRLPDNVVSFDLHDLAGDTDALKVRFDADQGSLWCTFNHDERPCFTPKLL